MNTLTWYTVASIISAIAVCTQALIFYKQWQLQHQLNDWQAREVKEGQARKISIWRDEGAGSDFLINNASDSPIYKVLVSCDEDENPEFTRLVGILPPGHFQVSYDVFTEEMHHSFYPIIWFQDYNNRCWKRSGNGDIIEIPEYFEDSMQLPQDRLPRQRLS